MKIIEFLKWVRYDRKYPRPVRPSGFRIYVGKQKSGKTASFQEYQRTAQFDYPDVGDSGDDVILYIDITN